MAADPTTIASPPRTRPSGKALLGFAPMNEPVRRGSPSGEEHFAAYIAHELRTPLATQRTLLELSLADPFVDPTSGEILLEISSLPACSKNACSRLASRSPAVRTV